MKNQERGPELLAPAGSFEAFLGCIAAGADAVYLGGPRFGARAYAKNLTEEEFAEAIRIAHLFGRKLYMTVNILTRQEELEDCVQMVKGLWEKGLDGVIVQDLGVLTRLSKECPGLLLHASTQMSVTSPEGARLLKSRGVSRIVPARELSLPEMKRIKEEGVEIECFIHGAMCYCYSGRCLMSSFLGGRSGNRGRCAGTCRLPYAVLDPEGRQETGKECYPLSMRDMCVLDILPELIDAGIDSFKIEGRMKKPEYAAGTTAIYRKYIDRYLKQKRTGEKAPWKIDPEDRKDLLSLYIRTDLSTGYYHRRNGKELVTMAQPGYAGADEKLLAKIREEYLERRPQAAVTGRAVLISGKPAELTLCAGDATVTAVSKMPVSPAKSRPMTEENIREKLAKTGNSDFVLQDLSVTTDGSAFIPVGALNQLRRDALSLLSEKLSKEIMPVHGEPLCLPVRKKKEAPAFSKQHVFLVVSTGEQLAAAKKRAGENTTIILDGPVLEEAEDGMIAQDPSMLLALPQVFRQSDRAWMEEFYKKFTGKCSGFLVRTLGEIEFLDEKGYDGLVMGDSCLYAWNKTAADLLETYTNLEVLPLDLSGRELASVYRDRMARKVLPVYGRVPMMVTAGCVKKTAGACSGKEDGTWYLRDRKNAVFPVRTACRHCSNIIYNSVPLSLHGYLTDPAVRLSGSLLLAFTIEDEKTTEEVLSLFLGPAAAGQHSGTADKGAPRDGEFTTGHFRKGAL